MNIDGMVYALGGGIFTTYYVSMSVFLAYAMSCPDMHILLWFVIPIKMRWMAYVYGAIILYDIISYIRGGLWFMAVPIVASLLNFVIFFSAQGTCTVIIQKRYAENSSSKGCGAEQSESVNRRHYEAQMCNLRSYGEGRSKPGIPFLF